MIKKLFLVSFLVLALAGVVLAQDVPAGDVSGGLGVDGEIPIGEAPLLDDPSQAGAFLGVGMIFVFIIGLLAFIFWIMMLVHAIKYPIENKVLWLLLILLTGIIGSIVYYFAVKRHYGKMGMPSNNMPPSNTGQ